MITSVSLVTSMMRHGRDRGLRWPRSAIRLRRAPSVESAHVDEEQSVATSRSSRLRATYSSARRRQPGAPVDARRDGGVEIEVLAVLEPAHHAIHLRAARAGTGAAPRGSVGGVVAQRLREELAGVAVEVELVRAGTRRCGSRRCGSPTRRRQKNEPSPARPAAGAAARRAPSRDRRRRLTQLLDLLARQLAEQVGDEQADALDVVARRPG